MSHGGSSSAKCSGPSTKAEDAWHIGPQAKACPTLIESLTLRMAWGAAAGGQQPPEAATHREASQPAHYGP